MVKIAAIRGVLGLKIHPNAFVVGVLPQTPLGEPPQTPSWLGKETADA